MPQQVILKKSSVAAKVPLNTDITYGELAINYADGKLYYRTDLNAIKYFVSYDDSVITSKAPIASPAFTGLPTTPTLGVSDYSTTIANTAYVKNLLGSASSTGVLDWNDVSNTTPGTGPTLLLGTATNGPGGGTYYHPFNLEYNSKNGTGNVTQMAIAYGSPGNELWMRGRFNGTWSNWVRCLNSNNFTSYVPSITGTGASGTWGITVTGASGFVSSKDTRLVVSTPQSFTAGISADFKHNTADGLADGGTFHGVMTFRQYASGSDWTGGGVRQLGFTDNHNMWIRGANADTTWSTWNNFLHTGNYNTYAPTLTGTGASGSWNINSATTTALQTTRLINGSSFNGTANITISEPTFFGGLSAYTTTTPDTVPANGGLTARYLSGAATNKPTGTDHSLLTMAYNSAWATQIAGDWRTNELYVRGNNNGTWSAWDKLYRTNDATTTETASKLALRDSNGDLTTRRFISTIATGTSPFGVASTTAVVNLNADMLDGQHASEFQTALVSGTNIKTINGATLLGAGDIPVATISDAMAIAIALG